ncbi:MAG: hypothetical protein JW384_03871 [Nitrosomonadaceae bacterium]|nr:hypothetical protein [Nitrosomonadaceae bacterium]
MEGNIDNFRQCLRIGSGASRKSAYRRRTYALHGPRQQGIVIRQPLSFIEAIRVIRTLLLIETIRVMRAI